MLNKLCYIGIKRHLQLVKNSFARNKTNNYPPRSVDTINIVSAKDKLNNTGQVLLNLACIKQQYKLALLLNIVNPSFE